MIGRVEGIPILRNHLWTCAFFHFMAGSTGEGVENHQRSSFETFHDQRLRTFLLSIKRATWCLKAHALETESMTQKAL